METEIRLLILHIAFVLGGAERTTRNLLEHLNRDEVSHITLAAPDILKRQLPTCYDSYVDTADYGLQGSFQGFKHLLEDAWKTKRLLNDVRADVALGMMHYPSALITMGARLGRKGTKTVASFRGPFYEYLRHQEKKTRRKLFLWSAVTTTTLLADRIIVPSHGTGLELQRRFLGRNSNIVVIPNGIDQKQAWRIAQQPPSDLAALQKMNVPLICAAARLAPEKDLNLLLAAFRQVVARKQAHLILLGEGPEGPALEAIVKDWGIADAVSFLGFRRHIHPYLHQSSLFLHTCHFEGFGYTILEAMACGTPVIATDCPYGPREVLGDNQYGQLVPPNDPQAMADAVIRLLEDDVKRRKLSELGLVRARELSVQRMVQKYQTVFKELAVESS
ncbi:MAG: glycosyltransferase [Gammaproteobacteria bacterium]|nr:glycosyltransferase [Gammaproteobacteria bacterium]